MIHLDTNALIALPRWLALGHALIDRVAAGERVGVCSVVWYEYLCGPVIASDVERCLDFIEDRIEPLDARHAQLAAELFNQAGRRRGLRIDSLVAATAICSGAELLTGNVKDFTVFSMRGLKLFA
ncbi:MAG: hypothetical protein JWQ90_4742 [Hydrocarboniphaga sp.]|uniref:type II toxin-antitoxin system VapC family toxin n=1 Tax=Hydrocarboniphaga sp. TaxID=2033016 RepID=UPI0026092133|nr:type II toxin-antitoxin system VapC family toxin [Hydrocarboniphaga sp.]MDB5972292.1 hypothetical protein [Hydrocarboniphaga sp.]